jgi:hypothetical protein
MSMDFSALSGKHDKQAKQTDFNYPQHRVLQVAHPWRPGNRRSLICSFATYLSDFFLVPFPGKGVSTHFDQKRSGSRDGVTGTA